MMIRSWAVLLLVCASGVCDWAIAARLPSQLVPLDPDRLAEIDADIQARLEDGKRAYAAMIERQELANDPDQPGGVDYVIRSQLAEAKRSYAGATAERAAGIEPDLSAVVGDGTRVPDEGQSVSTVEQAYQAPATVATEDVSRRVQVRGYTRKDGTVVAPYTRSAPRRR
jgi:hypothetical protein